LIEKIKPEDRQTPQWQKIDTATADRLPVVLERAQKILEYDLVDLESRGRLLSGSG